MAVMPDAALHRTLEPRGAASQVRYYFPCGSRPVSLDPLRAPRVHIEKARLPKTLSYPVRSSQVESALAAGSIRLDTQLIFNISKIFLDAHFWPASRRIPHERLYIRVGTVQAEEAHAARMFMVARALPEMVSWIGKVLALPAQSPVRTTEHYFKQDWDGGV
jgi:hypothetical protein